MVACADCHQKDSKVACDTCHYWHLPAGLEPHVPNAQKFRNGCTNCHKGGKQLFPENFQNGCYECHLDTTEPKVPKDWESMAKEATRSPQSIFKAKSGKPASKSKKLLKK
ncbi:MAG: hypothetical protein A2X94_02675 [Bdellovibrionales bacterium GWB1_55_8]|nr:MAG: hypothetical protein A2X94_02675 [Bdellovibrionales bacterium GWB1_55_8]